ncbi:ABC transporter ATP-binding protein [Georgenia thermotolerans]|uniref:ABC transporter ATP-binding protein n=1 Tax=Georgenia thermotolerans TaxID=527326 RepID=UPI001478D65A|nr:ABC transporter ATP-binding protein [Georgenia thermotolerans]
MTEAALRRAPVDRGSDGESVIEISGLTKRFPDVTALDGVSLTVRRGSVVGLLGHNGAGKTTILRHLAGLLAPSGGTVRVFGRDPLEHGTWVRRRIGMLPGTSILDQRLTARENLRFAAELFDLPATGLEDRIAAVLGTLGLGDRLDEKVSGYSAGMRQRATLAKVLLTDPELLLLDEPSTALDPVAQQELRALIRRASHDEGRTVVICTHDLAEAAALCDDVVILAHGRIVAEGNPAELAAQAGTAGVEIELAPRDEQAALAATAGRGEVVLEGPGRVRLADVARADIPAVLRDLVAAGVDVYAVRPRAGTLEDLYLTLHAGPARGTEES